MCVAGVKVDVCKFSWVLGDIGKLDCWSKLTALLSHLQSTDLTAACKDVSDKLRDAVNILNDIVDSDVDVSANDKEDEAKFYRVVKFCLQQLSLLQLKQIRYKSDLLRWAFQVFSLSPSTYLFIRDSCVMLPHPSYLRTLSSCFTVESGTECNEHIAYLTEKAKLLPEHERYVSLLLDEIYVTPKVSYKAGTVEGFAENCDVSEATTVQAFMMSSILSSKKDIAALIPIKNLTATYLKELTLKVIVMVEQAGYKIVCLISDNNRINGNMFAAFCNGSMQSSTVHPCDSTRLLFFLFDSVHLMKCVRNNWFNQKDNNQTLTFPDVADPSVIHKASVRVLKELYSSEKKSLIKLAPSLSHKALNPSNMDRQSVPLMLRVFNDKVVTALHMFAATKSDYDASLINGTRVFIEMMLRVWKMLNVKHPLKGRNLRDEDCDPIRSVSDTHLLFFKHVVDCLDVWEAMCDKTRTGVLTRETMSALRHTLLTMIELSKYLLQQLQFKYVLTGKFQTDCLEFRFAQYRRLAGTNYHVSVREIMESEKKLKLMSVLSLKSATFGRVSISKFSKDCLSASAKEIEDVSVVADEFSGVLQGLETSGVRDDYMRVLVFVAGYIGRKLQQSISCTACINEVLSVDDMPCDVKCDELIYIHALDRGGLKWPRQALVDIVTLIYCMFQRLLSTDYEKRFIAVDNHKQLAVYLCVELLQSKLSLNVVCEAGHDTMQTLFKPCASKMCNILLNNYCKRLNDAAVCAKGNNTKKTRKLATLNKS